MGLALGPPQWNDIDGIVNSNGTWTEGHVDRHKTDTHNGEVVLDLRNNVDGGLCVQLRDESRGQVFSNAVCWTDGEYGPKTLATGLRSGSVFSVEAKKDGSGNNSDWGGRIYY